MYQFTTAVVVTILAVSAVTRSSAGQSSVRAAVEAYQSGDRQRALEVLNPRAVTWSQLTSELDAWVRRADGADSERLRRLVAVAFALDAQWTATRPSAAQSVIYLGNSGSPRPTGPFAVRTSQSAVATWAVRQLPTDGTVTAAERALWLAAIGVAEDVVAWRTLLDEVLPLASKRLPDDPRVRLAAVLAQTSLDIGTPHSRRGSATVAQVFVVSGEEPLAVTKRFPAAVQSLETLLVDRSLAGEVELRIGHIELRRRNWIDALARFDATRSKTVDPILWATADFLRGLVYEHLDQPDAAVAAYRRAVAVTPNMRNLATRLSVLLFLRGDRAEAYDVLDRALNARPIPVDLLVSFERGDARFVEAWLSTAREALRGLRDHF